MAESDLQSKMQDYLRARRRQRGDLALSFFGINRGPTMEQQTAYNESLKAALTQIRMGQDRAFASRDDRIKTREQGLKNFINELTKVINKRMEQANDWEKAKLTEQNKALENYRKGLELHHKVLGDTGAVGGSQPASAEDKAKVLKTAQASLASFSPTPIKTGVNIGHALPNKQDQQEVLQALQAGGASISNVAAGVEKANEGRNALELDALSSGGVDTSDPQAVAYAMLALRQKTDPDAAYVTYLEQDHNARNLQLHYGGSFGSVLADLSKVATGEEKGSIDEVLDDILGELELSDEEAKAFSNKNRYEEQLMGSMYNPNAPSAAAIARDKLLADPSFMMFKEKLGFNSDRAAFIALRREMRKERKKAQREDRRLLRESRKGKGAQAIAAMKTLRENQQNAKTLQAPMPSASATVAQPQEPAMTTGKTLGGTNT